MMVPRRIRHLLFFLLFGANIAAQADLCQGNLGDNIFERGDFESGMVNIPNRPESIQTTYSYVGSGPPGDGQFVLTNNTGAWSRLYSTWLPIGDNSSDPNGYFMVVNADYSPGIFYEETIEGLCENTEYVFSADIINLIEAGVTGHELPNVSFLLDDEVQYETGTIPQTETWNTYGFTFTTEPGQTTLKLGLRNNAPGGIGNDLGLDNITFRACGPLAEILPVTIANICEDGDPIDIDATVTGDQFPDAAFQWQQSFDNGNTWENLAGANRLDFTHSDKRAGLYYYRYLIANSPANLENAKCRINSNTKIVQVVPKFWTITDTICNGLTYETANSAYTSSGVYVDSLISSLGCDSIVTLNLTVLPDKGISPIIQQQDPICAGDSSGRITIREVNNTYPPFQITLGEWVRSQPTAFEGLAAGTFDLKIEDRLGCSYSEQFILADPDPFFIKLGENIRISLGESVELVPETNYPVASYDWLPNTQERCETDCDTQEFLPLNTQTYKVTATSELGCEATDSILVLVDPVRRVYVPNVFTPNLDGINDYLEVFIKSPNVQEVLQFSIADRWGNLVYHQENIMPDEQHRLRWDGTFQNQTLPAGVYLYVLEVRYLDTAIERTGGDFTLIR